jgi:hypothetical protein
MVDKIALRNPQAEDSYRIVLHPGAPGPYVDYARKLWVWSGDWRQFNDENLRVYDLGPTSY